jgi:RNA polymerase sigma factor (sigma-70 family)
MPTAADDAALAVAAASGDRAAFGMIYDRYADRLHDFCVGMLRDRDLAADCVQDVFVTAASRLGQLREPERLRSWLYAIARNEALARIRHRRRELVSDELPEIDSGEPDLVTLAARSELSDLISDACGGLSDRDQVVLELSYRQGLDGPELAEALGVTNKNANTLVERLRETVARSLGALLVCRQVRADPDRCPELAALIEHWDGQFTVLMRKRAARHIESCPICEEERARMVSPAALLGAVPLIVPAPAWLRKSTLFHAGNAMPPAGATVPAASGHQPGAHPGSQPDMDESWWPARDLDISDLPDQPSADGESGPSVQKRSTPTERAPGYLRRHIWAVAGAAAIVAAGGTALLTVPRIYHVDPMSSTGHQAPPPSAATPVRASVPNPGPAGPATRPVVVPQNPGPSSPPQNSSGPVVPPGTPVGPVAPPVNPGGPVVPPGNPSGPVAPPVNPGGPVVPPGTPGGPVVPPVNSGGPVIPPGNPSGPAEPPSSSSGPAQPPGSSGGPAEPPGKPSGPVEPPKKPPLTPSSGPVVAPGHIPPKRLGENDCTPPACIPTSGPIG